MTFQGRSMIALPVAIPAATYDGLGRMARQHGYKREIYAANLLVAAYSARVKPTGDDPELEAAVASLKDQAGASDDTIRHLIKERDGWKKTAEDTRVELNNVRAEKATLVGTSEARHARIKAVEQELSEEAALRVGAIERLREAEAERDALWAEAEDLQIKNDQLLTELASCARPLPPIITVTAAPERSPELNEALSHMATTAVEALRQKTSRFPEPYGLDPNAAEEKPSEPEAPLTPSFIRIVVGYRWAGWSIETIARSLRCDEHKVRRALKAKGRAA